MTIEIKVSTAHTFLLGPFVDATDGVAVETGLATAMDNASTGIRLSKNGGNMGDRNDGTAPVHDEDGWYTIVLDTTDTGTLGLLQVEFSDPTVALPAWQTFSVVTANYWDTKYSTDTFDVNVTTMAANSIATGVIATDAIGATAMAPNSIASDVMAANSIATGVIATDAIGVLAMAAGSISAGTIASGELTNIEDEIWDALKSAHTTPDSFGDFLDDEITSRQASGAVDLNADQSGVTIGTVNLLAANAIAVGVIATDAIGILAMAPNSIAADVMAAGSISSGVIAAAELTNIENEIWDATMASHITADTMGLANNIARANVATGGGASTITLDAGASALADFYNGSEISLVNGTGAGQTRRIIDYDVTTFIATVDRAWITNPISGTEFVITAGGQELNLTALGNIGIDWGNVENQGTTVDLSATTTSIVDTATAVTAISANGITSSSMATDSISSGTIASGELTNIENEIWNALKSAHTTPNSFGDFLDIETSSRLASADIALTGGAVDNVTLVATTTAVTNRVTANTDQWAGGTVPAQGITGVPEVDVTHFVAELAPAPIITGVPDVNTVRILDVAPTLTNSDLDVNLAQVIGTAPTLTGTDIDVNVAAMDAGTVTAAAVATDAIDADALATDAVNLISRAIGIRQNQAFSNIAFLMVLTSDHVTPATGLTVTGTMRIDNAAFVAVNGTITEVANGIYEFDALAADTNGILITYRFISGTADDTFVTIKTVA